MYVCPACAVNPNAHSLKKLDSENALYYYTCPAKSELYNDVTGIVHHYEGVLSEIRQPWIWVFDGTGFGMKHALEVNVGIQLAGIMNKYSELLQQIIIIHPSVYVSSIYTLLYPFLNKKMRAIIYFPHSEISPS